MELGVATHFAHGGDYGEGWSPTLVDLIGKSGADGIRDELIWSMIETKRGVYDFSDFRSSYLDYMERQGVDVTLTLIPGGNALYDNGATVWSSGGIAGFAKFAAAAVKEFPGIDRLVVGNEHNGLDASFVNGVAAQGNVADRAAKYTELLRAVHNKVAATGSDVEIVGGALHSVATGYVEALIEAGAFQYMDALDFHPYGLEPEELAAALDRLNEVLDTLPQNQRPELIVTEFARPADAADPLANTSYLLKMAAVLSEAGVSSANWYALLDEDYAAHRDMGLFDSVSDANPIFNGFQFLSRILETSSTTVEVDSGPGLEVFDFGNGTLMVWGTPQEVSFSGANLVFRDATGKIISRPTEVTDEPIYVQGKGVAVTATGDGQLLADSYHDFSLAADPEGPWSYHGHKIVKGKEAAFQLEVMDGQEQLNENWNPYLGNQWSRPFFLTADTLMTANFGDPGSNQRNALERYTVEKAGRIDIIGSWNVSDQSQDGIIVAIRINGETVEQTKVGSDLTAVLRGVEVAAGDTVDFIVMTNQTGKGDLTTRHIRIYEADQSIPTNTMIADHLATDVLDRDRVGVLKVQEFWAADSGKGTSDTTAPLPETEPEPVANTPTDLKGTKQNDMLETGSANDTVNGLTGNDTLKGGGGNDKIFGGDGRDLIYGGAGNDTLIGGGGNDTLRGEAGRDVVMGGAGDDVLYGTEDKLIAGAGNDTIFGSSAQDTMMGGAGHDLLHGYDAQDVMIGGAGHDTMNGGAGNDRLQGGGGNDSLVGDAGADVINGGLGHDTLDGGAGVDRMIGGGGSDVFVLAPSEGRDIILDFRTAQGDRLDLTAFDFSFDELHFTQKGTSTLLTVGEGANAEDVALLHGTIATAFTDAHVFL